MPLSSWSHTGFFHSTGSDDNLSPQEELNLKISKAIEQAILEGRGSQYEVTGGVASIAHVEDIDLPRDAVDNTQATNNLIAIVNPPELGGMLVTQLTQEQNDDLSSKAETHPIGPLLLSAAFTIGINGQLPGMLRRLYAISRHNTEWEAITKPHFGQVIQEGKLNLHEILKA